MRLWLRDADGNNCAICTIAVYAGAIAVAAIVAALLFGPQSGCVSAGYRSGTITHPDGRKETYRSASYVDAREGARGAMDFVSGVGDGLFGSGSVAGLLGGGGVVGALGWLWRNGAVAKARKQGEDKGWSEARETFSPPPSGGTA